MSTNAAIGIRLADGSVRAVRLNWDGYVGYAGAILGGWYKTAEQVEALLALGELSEIKETPETCVAYHRDMGEDYRAPFTFETVDEYQYNGKGRLVAEYIDLGIEEEYDIDEEENEVTLYGDPKSYAAIQKWFEENGFEVKAAEFTRIPNDLKDVTPEQRETIDKIVERLDEDDDVQNVYTNMKPLDEE